MFKKIMKNIDWKLIFISMGTLIYFFPIILLEKFPQTGEGGFIFAVYFLLPIFIVLAFFLKENFNDCLKKFEKSYNDDLRDITQLHLARTDELTKELIEEILKNEVLRQKLQENTK